MAAIIAWRKLVLLWLPPPPPNRFKLLGGYDDDGVAPRDTLEFVEKYGLPDFGLPVVFPMLLPPLVSLAPLPIIWAVRGYGADGGTK